jgi:hypothetical protein
LFGYSVGPVIVVLDDRISPRDHVDMLGNLVRPTIPRSHDPMIPRSTRSPYNHAAFHTHETVQSFEEHEDELQYRPCYQV